jgi:hypothetical protein
VGKSVKSKAVSQHTYGGVGEDRMYSSYSFSTSTLDAGEWSAWRPDRALPAGKDPRYPLYAQDTTFQLLVSVPTSCAKCIP